MTDNILTSSSAVNFLVPLNVRRSNSYFISVDCDNSYNVIPNAFNLLLMLSFTNHITNFLICFFSGSMWNMATLLLICRWGFGVSILVIAADIAAVKSVNAARSIIDTIARINISPTPIIPNSQYPIAESIDSPLTTAAADDAYKHIRRLVLLLNLNFVI